jgi:hypothetical protein
MISKREWDILDRFTKIDEKIALLTQEQARATKLLEEIKNLLAGRPPPPIVYPPVPRVEIPRVEVPGVPRVEIEPILARLDRILQVLQVYEEYIYISYPADGSKKSTTAGRVTIDFYEGTINFPDGTTDRLSAALKAFNKTHIHSFAIEVNASAKYKFDDAGAIPIDAGDYHVRKNLRFQRVTLEFLTDTEFAVQASTNPFAVCEKITPISLKTTLKNIQAVDMGPNVIWTPAAGKKVKVKLIDVWNSGTSDITIDLRFTSTGTGYFKKTISPKSGFIANLVGSNWEGNRNEALYIFLDTSGIVDVTVLGEEVIA